MMRKDSCPSSSSGQPASCAAAAWSASSGPGSALTEADLGVARPASFQPAPSRAAAPAIRPDPRVGSVVTSGSSVLNGVIVHHLMPRLAAVARTSLIGRNAAPPRSIGTCAPAAALTHEASRNSWLVRTRSAARVLIRSGSQATTSAPGGSESSSSSIRSASSGANASMPSTVMPSAILLSTSPRPGYSEASCLARCRTAGVSSSSRHGGAQTESADVPSDRWSAARNGLISSISEPKNSTRSGCSSVGGNTSRMPPRTAISPRLVTRSTRA